MKLKNISTNIITGFLGSGKTTAILHLLEQKPDNERWAVLVNEFGEIGIDGSLIEASIGKQPGVYINEVPGGCMCCAAGVSMQVALNTLLKQSRPDRLLIEPTGLGHPKEVLKVLSSDQYKEVLKLQNTLTLVDARNISDSRYTNHDIFNQQLEIADVIVANKADLYQSNELKKLGSYLHKRFQSSLKPLHQVSFAEIEPEWLTADSAVELGDFSFHSHAHQKEALTIPECGYLTVQNQGEGFYSQGWLFNTEHVFDSNLVIQLFEQLGAERIKAVVKTASGSLIINKAEQFSSTYTLNTLTESRIEIIVSDRNSLSAIESDVLSTRVSM